MRRPVLIRGPLHHQVEVRVAALIGIADSLMTLIGFSTGWEMGFMFWCSHRRLKKKAAA